MTDTNNFHQGSEFELLSDEMVLHIFSFLNKSELHLNAALVCKKWCRLSRDPTLMNELSINGDYANMRIETDRFKDVLSRATQLKDFEIAFRGDMNELLQIVAQVSGTKLEKLTIRLSSFFNDACHECASLIERECVNLKSLMIESKLGGSSKFDAAMSHFSKIKSLKAVFLTDLSCDGNYVQPGHIINIAQNCASLEKMTLRIWYMKRNMHYYGDTRFEESINTLLRLRKGTLKVLVLDRLDLDDNAFSYLSKCEKLEEFELNCLKYYRPNPLVLTEISKLTTLKRLKYSGHHRSTTKDDFQAAFDTNNLSTLIDIDFSRCENFDDDGLISLAKVCKGLTKLKIDGCKKITDEGILYLTSECKQLEYLSCSRLTTFSNTEDA